MIEIHPLATIGEVLPGTDLVTTLCNALTAAELAARTTDIIVVTQKIVSKAEGRFATLGDVHPGAEALRLAGITGKDPRLIELVLAESTLVLRAAPNVLITRHRCGYVMANAGIDRSNTGSDDPERVLLLPKDADLSAERLRLGLAAVLDHAPAIVISDSFGRPWRYGVVSVAIGVSGLPALLDRRGELDRNGRRLEVTQVALGDILATAASLASGEGAEGVPAVLVRGAAWPEGSLPASRLVRPLAEDLFQ